MARDATLFEIVSPSRRRRPAWYQPFVLRVLVSIAMLVGAGCGAESRRVPSRSTTDSPTATREILMTFDQAIDTAQALGAKGQVAEEVRLLQAFLARATKSPEEESRALSKLSSARLRLGDLESARSSVERALAIAVDHHLEGAEAEARLRWATLSFTRVVDDPGGVDEAVFEEGLKHALIAGDIYKRLGSIDFLGVVLTIAEAARYAEELEVADAMYRLLLAETQSPPWTQQPSLQDHLRGLRARASYGLAGLALIDSRTKDARYWLTASTTEIRSMTVTSVDETALLRDIADAIEEHLGDAHEASRVRAMVGGLPP